jgi:hypothetical protein
LYITTASIPIEFDNALKLHPQPDSRHEWLLTTEEVASGFGVRVDSVHRAKRNRSADLVTGKHFVHIGERLLWTKRGVIRLGYFMRSPRARQFRDFCEDLTIQALERITRTPSSVPDVPPSVDLSVLEHAARIHAVVGNKSLRDVPELHGHLRELVTLLFALERPALTYTAFHDAVLEHLGVTQLEDLKLHQFRAAEDHLRNRIKGVLHDRN